MLRAYRIIITNNPTPQRTYGKRNSRTSTTNHAASGRLVNMKQRFFLNEKALNWENTRIWHTHHKPKPAHDNVTNWQAYLEWHR